MRRASPVIGERDWINRYRRTIRDNEPHPDHDAAMVQWAMVTIMTRRLARQQMTLFNWHLVIGRATTSATCRHSVKSTEGGPST